MNRVCIVVMAKAPLPGFAKTRLIPALGEAGAARLAARMLAYTLEQAQAAGCAEVELCATPDITDSAWALWGPPTGVQVASQGNGDLGERLARAAARTLARGLMPLIIGTDCPALDARRLQKAAAALSATDVVLHGTLDGGYALIGLARGGEDAVFTDIDWSTERVFAQTLERIQAARLQLRVGDFLQDIDEPKDLCHLPPDWLAEGEQHGAS